MLIKLKPVKHMALSHKSREWTNKSNVNRQSSLPRQHSVPASRAPAIPALDPSSIMSSTSYCMCANLAGKELSSPSVTSMILQDDFNTSLQPISSCWHSIINKATSQPVAQQSALVQPRRERHLPSKNHQSLLPIQSLAGLILPTIASSTSWLLWLPNLPDHWGLVAYSPWKLFLYGSLLAIQCHENDVLLWDSTVIFYGYSISKSLETWNRLLQSWVLAILLLVGSRDVSRLSICFLACWILSDVLLCRVLLDLGWLQGPGPVESTVLIPLCGRWVHVKPSWRMSAVKSQNSWLSLVGAVGCKAELAMECSVFFLFGWLQDQGTDASMVLLYHLSLCWDSRKPRWRLSAVSCWMEECGSRIKSSWIRMWCESVWWAESNHKVVVVQSTL